MRKIGLIEIVAFITMVVFSVLVSLSSVYAICQLFHVGLSFSISTFFSFVIFFMFYTIAIYRLFLLLFPMKSGAVMVGSSHEKIYHIYILFYLMFFYSFVLSPIVPVPFRRLMYIVLGARIGDNTYPSGVMFDPIFVKVGAYCAIGYNSCLVPHIMVAKEVSHHFIDIGDRVTIGVQSTVFGDVVIEDDAVILPHAVVKPGTRIKKGQIWGGIPAKHIKIADI